MSVPTYQTLKCCMCSTVGQPGPQWFLARIQDGALQVSGYSERLMRDYDEAICQPNCVADYSRQFSEKLLKSHKTGGNG